MKWVRIKFQQTNLAEQRVILQAQRFHNIFIILHMYQVVIRFQDLSFTLYYCLLFII
jgi:hypothetical protein